MRLKQIEHIGIAVRDLEASKAFYEGILGLKCYKTEYIEDQKVKTAFYRIGEVKIELLESTDPEGPVSRFIERRGEGIHHLAFMVDGLENTLDTLNKREIRLIDTQPRKGADGMNIAFLHPAEASGVLVEFCEPSSQNKGSETGMQETS